MDVSPHGYIQNNWIIIVIVDNEWHQFKQYFDYDFSS